MALIKCPECGKDISDKAQACIHCGYSIAEIANKQDAASATEPTAELREKSKQRNGYHMCVCCGRCDDICPEYISFSNCTNKLDSAMEAVAK